MVTPFKSLHMERWAVIIEEQKKIAPFPFTLEEAAVLWGLTGWNRNAARNTLQLLEDWGYIKKRKGKRYFMYYAIDPLENDDRP